VDLLEDAAVDRAVPRRSRRPDGERCIPMEEAVMSCGEGFERAEVHVPMSDIEIGDLEKDLVLGDVSTST
jgi:hypothetical protein